MQCECIVIVIIVSGVGVIVLMLCDSYLISSSNRRFGHLLFTILAIVVDVAVVIVTVVSVYYCVRTNTKLKTIEQNLWNRSTVRVHRFERIPLFDIWLNCTYSVDSDCCNNVHAARVH